MDKEITILQVLTEKFKPSIEYAIPVDDFEYYAVKILIPKSIQRNKKILFKWVVSQMKKAIKELAINIASNPNLK